MRVRLVWKRFPGPEAEAQSMIRLREAFAEASKRTLYYSSYPAGVPGASRNGASLGWSPRDCLPVVPIGQYIERPTWFATRRRAPLPEFRHPGPVPERTAAVGCRVRRTIGVRNFADWTSPDLAMWKPETIAAPLESLRQIAVAVQRGESARADLEHAVIAFTNLHQTPLSDGDRDLFWQAFRAPVFEQLVGFSGELLATECEAHDGLHPCVEHAAFESRPGNVPELLVSLVGNPSSVVFRLATDLGGEITSAPCACGRGGPRLIGLRRLDPVDAIARSARAAG